jgi:hypothetical protein
MLLHRPATVFDICISRDGDYWRRHTVSRGQLERIPAFGNHTARDVAIGYDTDGLPAVSSLDDGDLSTVVFDH